MAVTLEADGAIELMNGMSRRSVDLSEVLTVIASDLLTFTDDAFVNSRGPGGQPWKELDPKTTAARRGRKDRPIESDTILVDSAILRNSMTAVPGVTAILIGSNVAYSGVHQFGFPDGGIVARPFMPVRLEGEEIVPITEGPAEEEWERYEELIATFIETGEILQG